MNIKLNRSTNVVLDACVNVTQPQCILIGRGITFELIKSSANEYDPEKICSLAYYMFTEHIFNYISCFKTIIFQT